MFKRTITCIAMILSLIVPVALFLEPNNCSASESNTKAELVQISDYKLYDFYSILQMHNIAKQTGLSFSGIKHMSVPAVNYYEPHIVFVNSNDKNGKCVLGLFTNKSGVVSKITINAEYDDVKAINAVARLEYVILGALGIDDMTAREFLSDIWAQQVSTIKIALWNARTNSNIIVEHGPSFSTAALFEIRLTAVNRKY